MAEQAFLDKEEENIRNRRMELKREEQSFYHAAASSPNEESISSASHVDVLDPFADHFKNNDDNDSDEDSFYHHYENASSSGENTAILINSKREESDVESVHENDHHMSSSNLQFPDASQIIVTDSEATTSVNSSRAVSDSEESWDAVSENEWARQSDSEYEH